MSQYGHEPSRSRILIVDDEQILADTLAEFLLGEGFDVVVAHDAASALQLFDSHQPEILLCDIQLPGTSGVALVKQLLEKRADLVVMMITAYATVESAIAAFRAGARDYLIKPVLFDDLMARLGNLEEWLELKHENRALRRKLTRKGTKLTGIEAIVGSSPAINQVKSWIVRISRSQSNVLIIGESGTGKELAARAIHELGPNPDAPLMPINCAAIPADLLENQLFGYVRGAFTGADKDRNGLFIAAGDGTVFLDEIGELPLNLQAKLLRVIENREVLPVGAVHALTMKARIVAATNKNLEIEVQQGRFRADLYYRLNVVNVAMPLLAARRQDIPEITEILISRHALRLNKQITGIAPEAMQQLIRHDWPGNVRELDNRLERAVILADSAELGLDDLFPQGFGWEDESLKHQSGGTSRFSIQTTERAKDDLRESVRDFEREHIRQILNECGDDRKLAASRLGLGLSSLYAKIKELGLN